MKNQPCFSIIVAMSENRVIGKANQLPWYLPADLKHFKSITMGHPILMGRKTHESIGKPLPGRDNIILTRDAHYEAPGCIVVTSIDEALESGSLENQKEIFIIGGAQIFEQLLDRVNRIYMTIIEHHFDGDVFFPILDMSRWQETSNEKHSRDEKNAYAYRFLVLDKVALMEAKPTSRFLTTASE